MANDSWRMGRTVLCMVLALLLLSSCDTTSSQNPDSSSQTSDSDLGLPEHDGGYDTRQLRDACPPHDPTKVTFLEGTWATGCRFMGTNPLNGEAIYVSLELNIYEDHLDEYASVGSQPQCPSASTATPTTSTFVVAGPNRELENTFNIKLTTGGEVKYQIVKVDGENLVMGDKAGPVPPDAFSPLRLERASLDACVAADVPAAPAWTFPPPPEERIVFDPSIGGVGSRVFFVEGGALVGSSTGFRLLERGADNGWVEQSVLVPNMTVRVAAAADVSLVVGDHLDSDPDDLTWPKGEVGVYRQNGQSYSASGSFRSPGPEGADWFGSSAAVSGDTFVVGHRAGSGVTAFVRNVYFYRWNGTAWQFNSQLSQPQDWFLFGPEVAISGDVAMIGGYQSTSFARFDSTNTTWVLEQTLGSSTGEGARAVAIEGDLAVGGYYGGVRIFERTTEWSAVASFAVAPDATVPLEVKSAAIANGRVIIGYNREDPWPDPALYDATESSGVVIYEKRGSWLESKRIHNPEPEGIWSHDRFGVSIAAKGDEVLIGSPSHADPGRNLPNGAVYLYSTK